MVLIEPVGTFIDIVGSNIELFGVLCLSITIIFYSLFVLAHLIINYNRLTNKRLAIVIIVLTEVIAVAELQLLVKVLAPSNYLSFDLIINTINATALIYSFVALNRNERFDELLGIKPKKEKIIPKENKENNTKRQKLKKGSVYLIPEAKTGYEIFTENVMHGDSGLVITKEIPERIRTEHKLKKTPIIRLDANFTKKIRIDDLISKITEFLSETGEEGIVIIDCLDRILTSMSFETTFKIIQVLRDKASKHNNLIIISVNTDIFERKELAMIEEETEQLPKDKNIDEQNKDNKQEEKS